MVHGFRWVGREQLEDVVLFAINSSWYVFGRLCFCVGKVTAKQLQLSSIILQTKKR